MVLQRWDPFVEMRSMEDAINRMWRGLGHRPAEANGGERWHIPLDVVEEGDDIVVHASLPGVEPNDIEVNVEDGVLTIGARTAADSETRKGGYLLRERRSGAYHRALRLPDAVDEKQAESSYDRGVLTVRFAKQEAKKARRLEVKVK